MKQTPDRLPAHITSFMTDIAIMCMDKHVVAVSGLMALELRQRLDDDAKIEDFVKRHSSEMLADVGFLAAVQTVLAYDFATITEAHVKAQTDKPQLYRDVLEAIRTEMLEGGLEFKPDESKCRAAATKAAISALRSQ